jgi:hypothetical protein
VNHRIPDAEDYKHHHTYTWEKSGQSGVERHTGTVCLVIGVAGNGIDAPTRAKALNLHIGEFPRV